MNDNDKQPGQDGNGPNPWMKSLLIWVGILLALAMFVAVFDSPGRQTQGTAIAYSAFLDKVEEGTVRDVNVSGDVISGTLTDDSKFKTYAMADPQLTDKLRAKHVVITAKPEEGPAIWQVILVQSLPFLLFLGIAFFVLRQMQKNSGRARWASVRAAPRC